MLNYLTVGAVLNTIMTALSGLVFVFVYSRRRAGLQSFSVALWDCDSDSSAFSRVHVKTATLVAFTAKICVPAAHGLLFKMVVSLDAFCCSCFATLGLANCSEFCAFSFFCSFPIGQSCV